MNFQNLISKINDLDKTTEKLTETRENHFSTEVDLNSVKQLAGLAECGMMPMPGVPHQQPVTMNVSVNATGTDSIRDLLDLLTGVDGKLGGEEHGAMDTPAGVVLAVGGEEGPEHGDGGDALDIDGDHELGGDDEGEGEEGHGEDDIELESNEDGGFGDATTEPEPGYKDVDYMEKELAGGLNGPKDMHKHGYHNGDNPLAMESLKSQLENLYKEVKSR